MLNAPVTALVLLAALLPVTGAMAQDRPSLVVVIVVDQMRRDYIDDYGSKWRKGLRRLVDDGAWFTSAAYPYTTTLTCAGHATIATGTLPSTHGVISNQWWDRAAQQAVSCTGDREAREVPYGARKAGSGGSAKQLAVPTLASVLGAAGGRVVAVSLKRTAAAMLAGNGRGDAVLWFQGGGWSSSTAWSATPEKSLLRHAERTPIEEDFGRVWDRVLRKSDYRHDDKGLGEKPSAEWDVEMPHALQPRDGRPTMFFYEAWQESPYSDDHLARLATAAIEGMKLGRGPATDFLGISFSALDIVGHDFGPRSHEVQDVMLHLDASLARLFEQLDRRVGLGKYVVAFTADHGVATIPEQMLADGADAGRIMMNETMTIVEDLVTHKLGGGPWVATQAYSEFYFRGTAFEKVLADGELIASIKKALLGVPGVARVYDRTEIPGLAESDDPLARAVAAGYFPARSGDLLIIPKANWIFVTDDKTAIPGNATTHGSGYPYDTRVPMILLGAGIAPGRYDQPATPADLAPTLAQLVGVALPQATGRVLVEAIKR